MNSTSPLRKIALMAGVGYLVIFFTGIFANFFVLEKMVVPDDAGATLANITGNTGQYRLGVFCFIVMVLFDLILTWALYVLLESVNKPLALFAAWFRLVNCAIFGVALYHLFDVLELTGNSAYQALVSTEYLQAEVTRSLAAFNYTWLLGLLFFGIHLLALGALTLQSGFVPKFIGVLLLLAGAGYLVDSFAQFLLPNYADYKNVFMMIVVIPGVVGELSFTVWLLFRGGRQPIGVG
ncbi:MAG: DUF4386 domain-containing protein [Saprospiraceae bacterium]